MDQKNQGNFEKVNNGIFQTPSARSDDSNNAEKEIENLGTMEDDRDNNVQD